MRPRIGKAARELRGALGDLVNGGASKRFAALSVALGMLLLIGIWFMFDVLPDLVVDHDGLAVNERLQRENDARTTGLQALAGIVLAIGGAFTAYSVLSSREDKLDERFARSLELMASNDAHVVSGAVFSLERIAVQSRFDRPAVVDVLSGFLRDRGFEDPPRPEELQTLRVLSRVKELRHAPRPDLRRTGWQNAQLQGLRLGGIVLRGSNFDGAILSGTSLAGVDLLEARMTDVFAYETDLRGASLLNADLSSAQFVAADLSGADLSIANMTGILVDVDTKLDGADLSQARLRDARFVGTDLSKTDLGRARTQGAMYSSETRFAPGFDPGEHGMLLEEG